MCGFRITRGGEEVKNIDKCSSLDSVCIVGVVRGYLCVNIISKVRLMGWVAGVLGWTPSDAVLMGERPLMQCQ